MSCCSEIHDLGCIDHCQSFDTGFDATQTGVHTFEVQVGNNTFQTFTSSFTIGGDIIIPADTLNESRNNDFKLKQPDGTYYAWSTGVTCARVTTGIYDEIVT